jgi:hypothetical protein
MGWATPTVYAGSWAGVTALGLVVVLALTGWVFRDRLGMGGGSTAGTSVVAIPPDATNPDPLPSTNPGDTDASNTGTPDRGSGTGITHLVDLPVLAARADETASDNVDASSDPVSYTVDNTFDGRRSTAWRVAGDGTGLRLTFQFASPVHIVGVGLIPGYDKIDPKNGTDRFVEERRITAVDWDFGDGTHASQDLEDSRALQSLAMDATTSTVTLTIQGTTRPGKRDYTAISEVLFRGTP